MEGIAIIGDDIIQDANDQFALMFGYEKVPVGSSILEMIEERLAKTLSA